MTKFFELKKSDFEFSMLDETMEFNTYIEFLLLRKNTLFIILSDDLNEVQVQNVQSHINNYYITQRGYKRIKYLINANKNK